MRALGRIFAALVAILIAAFIAFQVSPWPGTLLIRLVFDKGARDASAALTKHLPTDVVAIPNQRYDLADPDALLDVYVPQAATSQAVKPLTIVWVHGGGWVSGRKEDIGNYARILAGRGFTVVSVDYTIAPAGIHPLPIRQVNAALGHLAANAARLHVNPGRMVLAGDSAGSHIVSQLAVALAEPAYAARLGVTPAMDVANIRGMLLHCGPYDIGQVKLDGPFGAFLRTVLWAYSGTKDFQQDAAFAPASVIHHVTARFPPAFISAGNADPLLPQSRAMAAKLQDLGVKVDTLFFPADRSPPLAHEYQFNLDDPAGVEALNRTVKFLQAL